MEFVVQKAVLKQVPFQLYFRVRLRAAARIGNRLLANPHFPLNNFMDPMTSPI